MYKKRPTKAELYARIDALEAANQAMVEKLEVEKRRLWERNIPLARAVFFREMAKRFSGTVCTPAIDHIDDAGYWFRFTLTHDNRVQTYCVAHTDIYCEAER